MIAQFVIPCNSYNGSMYNQKTEIYRVECKIYFSCIFREAKHGISVKELSKPHSSQISEFLKFVNLNFRQLWDIMQC